MSELKRYYAPHVLPERRYHDETEVVLAAEHEDEIAKLKALCSRANNYMRLMDGEEFELDQSFGTLKDELREAAK